MTVNIIKNFQVPWNIQVQHRTRWLFICLILGILVAIPIALLYGSLDISLQELVHFLIREYPNDPRSFIIRNIRLPRILGALWGGACLATAGLLLQVYFHNPIVGPFILGISSGATLMVALVKLTTLTFLGLAILGPYQVTLAALAGSLLTLLIVIAIARHIRQGAMLLIIGLMMGYLTSSLTNLLIAFAEAECLKNFTLWTLGSFAGYSWQDVQLVIILGSFFLLVIYTFSKPLNAFLLGEDYAKSMGINLRTYRLLIIFFSSALAGLITATAGPIAFIGLAVPHIARLSLGTLDNRLLVPAVAFLGALVTVLCDLLARSLFSPIEIPLSVITSFFGAPIVITLLLRRRTVL